MIIELDVTKVTLMRVENYLLDRMREIDGYPERVTVADECLSLILNAGNKAMREAKSKKSKSSKDDVK